MVEHSSSSSGHSNIQVANVQAFAACCNESSKIPPRYIRPEAEADPVYCEDNVDLPIIDLGRLLDPDLCQEESARLNHACEEWGFFQLVNHGISEEQIDKMKVNITEFFKLPLEQKQAYAIAPGGLEGYGQHFIVSEEQKLDWADLMYLITRPTASRNMALWPLHPPTFRDTLDKYSAALEEVILCLLGFMGRNLGVDPEIILSKFKDYSQGARINYYPPCLLANKVLGLSPHTDVGALTLLLQLSDVQGLQIRNDGKWFPVKVLSNAFVVNIGDTFEILSNGRYKSIEHRAVNNTEKERVSIATFTMPPGCCTVGPLPEITKEGEEKYKSVTCENYLKVYLAAKLDGKSLLESMKLE